MANFGPYIEQTVVDEEFMLNCSTNFFPTPILDDATGSVGEFIPSKNFCNIRKGVRRYSSCQLITPICVDDLVYRFKTPTWTSRDFIPRYQRKKNIDLLITNNPRKSKINSSGLNTAPGRRVPPVWLEAMAMNQTGPGPHEDHRYLHNCLDTMDTDDSHCVLAFNDGGLNESLRIVVARLNDERDDRNKKNLRFSIDSSINEWLKSEILEVDFLPKLGVTNETLVLCRTSENVRLLSYRNDTDSDLSKKSSSLLLEAPVTCLKFNPYIHHEYGALCSDENRFMLGYVNSSQKFVMKLEKRKASNPLVGFEWTDHPRCAFLYDRKSIFLYDVRSGDARPLTSIFWTPTLETDSIRGIKRLPDDSRYFLAGTDASLFVFDHRQPRHHVTSVDHMLFDPPKYISVTDNTLTADGENRLIVLAGRELNQRLCVPLLWHKSSCTVCELEPPFELWSPEQGLLWYRTHNPLVTISSHFEKRCMAPVRGLSMKRVDKKRWINFLLTDVGDVYFTVMRFGRKVHRPDVWDAFNDHWEKYVKSRSCLYVENVVDSLTRDVLAKTDFDTSFLEDSQAYDNICPLCQTKFNGNAYCCTGCNLNWNKIDKLLKCAENNDRFNPILDTQENEKCDNANDTLINAESEFESAILSVWNNQ